MPPVPRGRPEVFRPNRVVGSPQGDDVIANGGWCSESALASVKPLAGLSATFAPGRPEEPRKEST